MIKEPEWIDIVAALALVGLAARPDSDLSEAARDAYKLASEMISEKEQYHGS